MPQLGAEPPPLPISDHAEVSGAGTSAEPTTNELEDPNLKRYDELLAIVEASPAEFDSWTALISTVEKLVCHRW